MRRILWPGEDSPPDKNIMEALRAFGFISELINERYTSVLKEIFDLDEGTSGQILDQLEKDEVFQKWLNLAKGFDIFKARFSAFVLDGAFTSDGVFQNLTSVQSAIPQLRVCIDGARQLLDFLINAEPALAQYEAAKEAVFEGRAEHDDQLGYGAIVAVSGADGG